MPELADGKLSAASRTSESLRSLFGSGTLHRLSGNRACADFCDRVHLVPVDVGEANACLVAFDIVEVNVRGSADVRWALAR